MILRDPVHGLVSFESDEESIVPLLLETRELQRLRRKTAALTEEDRAQVDALALEVARRLAGHLGAALDGPEGQGITPVVMRLFAVTSPVAEDYT